MARRSRSLAALALLLALPGCGHVVARGTPAPVSGASTRASASVSRPREARLEKVDPCALVGEADRRGLDIDRPPVFATNHLFESPACSFRSSTHLVAFQVVTGIKAGIEVMGQGRVNGVRHEFRLAGFPAVEVRTDGAPPRGDFCTVSVDVAPGNVLFVLYREDGIPDPLGKDELCRRATRVAEIAVTALLDGK
ncbi:DUF3558 domain-containing protein [Streptoalloteichus hindustanus]|uniref:DUF3558 domain-containing protein n=1 Tax=Streptoalloteichus hindustanus TaxID=2017 RepID=A0A1M5Q006_STRHI|nr:DUF3558 domain-containing protein [Streptoalloteichus hindustanus]SHH07328.1 Protein of unknown function [Streptoalloteichus hindustanus]